MAFTINTNITSLQAQESLRVTSDFQSKTINRVTSGLRIISSGDDAAGLAIANSFRSDQAVLGQGVRNANDALATLQTIDGGINNISKLLDRARTLATQSASGTFNGSRSVLNTEFQSVLSEIDRQSKAIGLDTGGDFAKSLSVFIGGGRGTTGAAQVDNGSVGVDLSSSTVDTRSLGLSGMRAAGVSGTDISTSSATTSVASIVADATNKASEATAGFARFEMRGAGFTGNSAVKLDINMSSVSDTTSLVAAVNSAIENAANGTTQAAAAFKAANIKAVVVSDPQADGSAKQRLGFISSDAAFQVAAADRMANALMGNFSSGATGKMLGNYFVASTATAVTTTDFSDTAVVADATRNIVFRFAGGGLDAAKDITISVASTATIDAALVALQTAVNADADLQAAGISVATATAGEELAFHTTRGESLKVDVAGDYLNNFGLGAYRLDSTGNNFDYSTITGSGFAGAAVSGGLTFSVAGGAKQSITFTATAAIATTVDAINAAISANSTLVVAGVVASNDGGQLKLSSSTGTAFRVAVSDQGAALNLGLGWAAAGETTTTADSYANAVMGTVTGGAQATTDTSNDLLYLKVAGTALAAIDVGTTANLTALVAALNGNGTFTGANMVAKNVNGQLALYNTNGDVFEVLGGTGNMNSVAGFETNQRNLAAAATFNSGGAYQTALGTNNDVFQWSQIRNGSSDQSINISVNDSTGVAHSIDITLRSDSIGRNARSLDEALAAINTALQQSGDATLKQVVAVKEQTYAGDGEGIRFLSKLSGFRVTAGQAGDSTAAAEVGIYDATTGASVLGQGAHVTSELAAGGSQVDISNSDTAKSAVTALAAAVSALGNAQAVVGKGQNQFNYAVNLASTQLSNLAASESRIRDADLASEAANLTKAQILLQAGIAAMAQANSAPQAVLSLLRG